MAIVVLFGAFTLWWCAMLDAPPDLLFDGDGYVAIANYLRAHWILPPPETRPPLYPVVIAGMQSLFRDQALRRLVALQSVAWLLGAPAVFAAAYGLGRKRVVPAVLAGCLYCTMAEPAAFTRLIYAEVLAMVAMLASLALFVAAPSNAGCERGAAIRLWSSALLALSAAYLRPIFQLALPILGTIAVLQRRRAKAAVPFAIALILGLGPWYLGNAIERGSAFFVKGAGYSLVNYIGDRRLLGHFPAGEQNVEDIYVRFFATHPDEPYAPWWEVHVEWLAQWQRSTGRPKDEFHAAMGTSARRILLANPGIYVRRWAEVWSEFSSSTFGAGQGWWCPIGWLQPLWVCFWGWLGVWLPFALLALEGVRAVRGKREAVVRLAPIGLYVALALANTAIEPWPGQVRYRIPLQPLLLIAVVCAAGDAASSAYACATALLTPRADARARVPSLP